METRIPAPKSARERLLSAAGQLFYEEGINTVGIDRIIERAGVAKASLYGVFGSKEELIRSYLESRQEARQARMTGKLARYRTPREKILGLFDVMAELFAERGFRGCAFMRANAEVHGSQGVKAVLDASRAWTLELFTQLAKDAGAANPKKLARQLVLLYDGATVSAQMDRDPGAANAARAVAAALLDAAT
ncbi:MAG: TetR/AcrR family transcriptional regulator [Usitatibacter sp.]